MEEIISKKLKEIRQNNKLSRNDLEDISGFKVRTIGAYERGENPPSKDYIKFISLYFGYTEKSIINDKETRIYKLDRGIQTLLMCQNSFNYSDSQMSNLLRLCITDYNSIIKSNNLSKRNIRFVVTLAHMINIKISCFFDLNKIDTNIPLLDFEKEYIEKTTIEDLKIFENLHLKDVDLKSLINTTETNGIEITPEYYASIIKKRNQPETITPLNIVDDLPPNHKKLISLLPYAPDTLIKEIIKKLETIKELHKL